jgi:hypothetical protein
MSGIFSESKNLAKIIEYHNWRLYDVTDAPKDRAYTWEELEKMIPSEQFEMDHNYLFTPIPKKGETLRQAYSVTKGLGPSLLIKNIDEKRWAGISLVTNNYNEKRPILFTRLGFGSDCLVLFTPKTFIIPYSDAVGIWYPEVIDTFSKYFRIVSPEEYGLKTPIPMPIVEGRMN